jgi:hypothetical protein
VDRLPIEQRVLTLEALLDQAERPLRRPQLQAKAFAILQQAFARRIEPAQHVFDTLLGNLHHSTGTGQTATAARKQRKPMFEAATTALGTKAHVALADLLSEQVRVHLVHVRVMAQPTLSQAGSETLKREAKHLTRGLNDLVALRRRVNDLTALLIELESDALLDIDHHRSRALTLTLLETAARSGAYHLVDLFESRKTPSDMTRAVQAFADAHVAERREDPEAALAVLGQARDALVASPALETLTGARIKLLLDERARPIFQDSAVSVDSIARLTTDDQFVVAVSLLAAVQAIGTVASEGDLDYESISPALDALKSALPMVVYERLLASTVRGLIGAVKKPALRLAQRLWREHVADPAEWTGATPRLAEDVFRALVLASATASAFQDQVVDCLVESSRLTYSPVDQSILAHHIFSSLLAADAQSRYDGAHDLVQQAINAHGKLTTLAAEGLLTDPIDANLAADLVRALVYSLARHGQPGPAFDLTLVHLLAPEPTDFSLAHELVHLATGAAFADVVPAPHHLALGCSLLLHLGATTDDRLVDLCRAANEARNAVVDVELVLDSEGPDDVVRVLNDYARRQKRDAVGAGGTLVRRMEPVEDDAEWARRRILPYDLEADPFEDPDEAVPPLEAEGVKRALRLVLP